MAFSVPHLDDTLKTLADCLIQHYPEHYNEGIYTQLAQQKNDPTSPIGKLAQGIAMSDFVAETLKKQPHFLHQCWQQFPHLENTAYYQQALHSLLQEVTDDTQLYRQLRLFRHREMAKLSLCQSLNLATVEEIFIALSQLAETIIIAARDWLYQRACAEMGIPMDSHGKPQQLYILGMGKLGGFELNFSSDIDLIFTYPANGETQGARRSIENSVFFTRLGQRLINALDQYTPDGFVYRTDMRLRPFGEAGALALSFTAMEQYYQEQGRDWERYAMIKGRILGADPQDPNIKNLQNLLRPFVYRRYIDFSVIQSLREMKHKIEREVRRRGLSDNIKLGAGGIREIEFIVQVFQLIRGGREIKLQQHGLLHILPELEQLALLSSQEVTDLKNAYLFLRRVENVLQAIDDKQTQLLPEKELDRQRLIVALQRYTQWNTQKQPVLVENSITSWVDFDTLLQSHQNKVRSVFSQLIGAENDPSPQENSQWNDFLETDLNEEDLQLILQQNGITLAENAPLLQRLTQFRNELARRPIGARGRGVLRQLMPMLLAQVFQHQAYESLLPRMLDIVDKILTRTAYLELLVENPQVLNQLIELCSHSQLIAQQVARHPILLDELLDRNALLNPTDFSEYASELKQYLLRLPQDDEEQFIDALRQFKQSTLLRVAAADILGALPVMKVSDHLTYLAEAIIAAVVDLAWQQVTARFGIPEYLPPNKKGFLVIGYGKLGGIELGYKSDLDLVFLFDGSKTGQTQGGRKVIDSNQFYLKLTQKIISIFSMNTSAGVLYDIDIRLRPSGDAGLLGCSLSAFENYQLNDAWTWEKQALVRSRAVYGDVALRQRFEQIRRKVLSAPRDLVKLKEDVKAMREKMYQHLAHTNPDEFNIKTDQGGITDIEFIAQYLVLTYAPQYPNLTIWSDNVRIFESMAELQNSENKSAVLNVDISEHLKNAYTRLRNRIHHLNLLGLPAVVKQAEYQSERQFIRQIWQMLFD
ncbi:bifunctional [glutamate--ammonia ligase]-adenylyl-L-tyrosine phosphorylase/[glutamate--ammonia-ligase] adenylyltransferase [Avibacterium sp. 20-129]|uniref:bifunctional [glutamate--ammonia ligase]-adenylyl-L-tyrosine phosphorylase/[glutamate--ammonia-ligase] adenylyltransferase n=1 Tax=Avibacterium sp. 20-129 TaxID=2911525 RepID=UPI0022478898|nr:bifunctional [glutamate--ammonia ligase]-adenylyl-L-tyrosine phosphorylase/[glutamate--ammonia-ligase] adenylyltransferase [Avibacterium sp. 20-129]MCW9699982.1 bifunctional [glutamate--ammonia ligase]-adenylyl-L-tyrosine phosphorylase/[glutamate--ammonia-ligase] adenylyltransferase [Avibacterium sp. 20-129]